MIEYKGYIGVFEYEPEADQFAGHVEGIRGSITFYGKSVAELKRELATSVDEYLAFCKERGLEAAKPYSGRFNVRMSPEQHQAVAMAAASSGKSMNDWVVETLEQAIAVEPKRTGRKGRVGMTGTFVGESRKRVKGKV
jgi:predicted HicB family RNase H-like nuclease